jgi:hypothetical protein
MLIFKFYHVIYRHYKRFFYRKIKYFDDLLREKKNDRDVGYRYFIENKIIFIHIPKCGGKSINKYLLNNSSCGHKTIKENFRVFKFNEFWSSFKFTILRDPISRFVSAYNFVKYESNYDYQDKAMVSCRNEINKYKNINDFSINFINKNNVSKYLHFRPQYLFISLFGFLIVDKIFFFENLDQLGKFFNKKILKTNITKIKEGVPLNNDAIKHLKRVYSKDYDLISKYQQ